MQQVSSQALIGLATDIATEFDHRHNLAGDIAAVQAEIERDPDHARLFYENLALKLHNFYTGCERIFQTIVSEPNGASPSGFDWHRRLLERMGAGWQGRPALLSPQSTEDLREYLAFRHVVRNICGFEFDVERINRLIDRYPAVWSQVDADIEGFVAWLHGLAGRLDAA